MKQPVNHEWRNGGNMESIPNHIGIYTIIENYCKKEDVKNRYGSRINSLIRKTDECLQKINCRDVGSLKAQLQEKGNLLSKTNKLLFGKAKSELIEEMLQFYGFIDK